MNTWIFTSIGLLLCLSPVASAQELRLNEFLAKNTSVLADEDGEFSDWIEIWNGSSGNVSLEGWSLTDDLFDPAKWVLPDVELGPDEFLIVFASDKDRTDPAGELHTNFKLSGDGEYLALFEPGGLEARTEFSPAYPAQLDDISYGFVDVDGVASLMYLDPPSPGMVNSGGFQTLEPVEFSRERGVYPTVLSVALTHPEPDVDIWFTRDGTLPSAGQGELYADPLLLSATAVIRATAVKPGFSDAPVETHSFITSKSVRTQSDQSAIDAGFPEEWVEADGTPWTLSGQRPGAHYGMDGSLLSDLSNGQLHRILVSVPTVSLVMPIDDWFGDGVDGPAGIYANSFELGEVWERAVSLEWIEGPGQETWQVNCGVQVQGGSSTNSTLRNQLSLALLFQAEFGPTKLERNPFGPGAAERYDYLVLDAAHQNSINGDASPSSKRHAQELRDRFMMDLHGAMGSELIHGRPVNLYLNGLFWGVYHLHERPDHRYAAEYGGGESEEYDWVRNGTLFEGNSNPHDHPFAPGSWKTALEIARQGLEPGAMWQGEPAYEAIQKHLNLERYADYLLLNYYGGNLDWPHANWMMTAKARNGPNDTDAVENPEFHARSWDAEKVMLWGGDETLVGDGFYDRTGLLAFNSTANAVFFHTHLLAHPDWPMLMADRAFRHIKRPGGALYVEPGYDLPNTSFSPTYPERNVPASIYFPRARALAPAIILEYARWGDYWHTPGTLDPDDWTDEFLRVLNVFTPVRSGVLLDQLRGAPGPLYPPTEEVVFLQPNGSLDAGSALELAGPEGAEVWYTVDGSDPRLSGGDVSPAALLWSPSAVLTEIGLYPVRARALDGTDWSPIDERTYQVGVNVVINELVADNESVLQDPLGQFEDYVELFNRSDVSVDLTGWFLSDDSQEPTRWRIPTGTVMEPGEYLLIWCDGAVDEPGIHAGFSLSAGGEEILLTGPTLAGTPLLDGWAFGPQAADRAVARIPNGTGAPQEDVDPTPGSANPIDG